MSHPYRPDLGAEQPHDPVNHPRHYTSHPSGVEAITICEHYNFNLGNAIKYIWRAGLKGGMLEDLKKARWYLDREIKSIGEEGMTVMIPPLTTDARYCGNCLRADCPTLTTRTHTGPHKLYDENGRRLPPGEPSGTTVFTVTDTGCPACKAITNCYARLANPNTTPPVLLDDARILLDEVTVRPAVTVVSEANVKRILRMAEWVLRSGSRKY